MMLNLCYLLHLFRILAITFFSKFQLIQDLCFFERKFNSLQFFRKQRKLRVCLVPVKCFLENKYFPEMLISVKGKCIQAVWLSWNSFYGKSIPVFGSFKHFTENAFRFTEIQFPCLVCGSFYGKYEMRYKFKHLHYLDKPVTVQN